MRPRLRKLVGLLPGLEKDPGDQAPQIEVFLDFDPDGDLGDPGQLAPLESET